MKKILILILALWAVSSATVNTWVGDVNASTKNANNWTGDAFPGASDTILFSSAGNTNCTFDSAMSVGAVIGRVSYTAALNDGGYGITCAGVCSLGVGGNLTASGTWVLTGDANLWFYGAGTKTLTNLIFNLKGTCTWSINPQQITYKKIICAYPNKTVTLTGNSYTYFNDIVLNGGTLTANAQQVIITPQGSSYVFQSNGSIINGTGQFSMYCGVDPQTITLDTFKYSGTGSVDIRTSTGGRSSFVLSGDFESSSSTLSFWASSYYGFKLTTNNYAISQTGTNPLTIGANYAGNYPAVYNWGSSQVNVKGLNVQYTSAADTMNMGSSAWNVNGNWTNSTATVMNVGTSTLTFTNTAKATILSAGKAMPNLVVAATAGQTDSLADSSSWLSVTVNSGKIKGLSQGGTCVGNMTLGGTDSVVARMPSSKWWTFPNNSTFSQTTTGIRALDSMKVMFSVGGSWLNDSSVSVKQLKLSQGKLTLKSGSTTTINTNVLRDFTGTNVQPCSLVSSSAGNKTRIAFGVQPADTSLYLKDIAAQGFILYDTIRGVNGGGDSNVVFKDAAGSKYLTPSVPTLTTVNPVSGTQDGGVVCTLSVATELFSPCSASVDGGTMYYPVTVIDSTKGYFTTPVHAVGTVGITVKNADFNTVTKAAAFEYTSSATNPPGPISYTPSSWRDTVGTADAGHTITNGGGDVDSFTVSPALPAGLTLDSATGAISGTPTARSAAVRYVVTGYNSAGTASAACTISIYGFYLAGISPTGGDTAGGTTVTFTGQKFGSTRGTGKVWFGTDTAASYSTWTDSIVKAATKRHAAGQVTAKIKTAVDSATATYTFSSKRVRRGIFGFGFPRWGF